MVGGDITIRSLVVLEHRKLSHDQGLITAAIDQIFAAGDLVAQGSECRCDNRRLARDDKDSIASLGSGLSGEFFDLRFTEGLEQGRCRAFLADLDPGKGGGTVAFDEFLQLIQLLS